jgi:hypothetical protein
MTSTIRTLILLLTLGFFAATTANACDGDKTACKGHAKGTKTAMKDCAKHMKDGKCSMTAAEMKKSGCCATDGKTATMETAKTTKAVTMKTAKTSKTECAPGTASTGKHDCCKGKQATAEKS